MKQLLNNPKAIFVAGFLFGIGALVVIKLVADSPTEIAVMALTFLLVAIGVFALLPRKS